MIGSRVPGRRVRYRPNSLLLFGGLLGLVLSFGRAFSSHLPAAEEWAISLGSLVLGAGIGALMIWGSNRGYHARFLSSLGPLAIGGLAMIAIDSGPVVFAAYGGFLAGALLVIGFFDAGNWKVDE